MIVRSPTARRLVRPLPRLRDMFGARGANLSRMFSCTMMQNWSRRCLSMGIPVRRRAGRPSRYSTRRVHRNWLVTWRAQRSRMSSARARRPIKHSRPGRFELCRARRLFEQDRRCAALRRGRAGGADAPFHARTWQNTEGGVALSRRDLATASPRLRHTRMIFQKRRNWRALRSIRSCFANRAVSRL